MRRTPYSDRFDRSYARNPSRQQQKQIPANSFRLQISRLPEDNFVAPRSPHQFYQPRAVRPLIHRPLTTQKPSLLDSRRQSHDSFQKRSDPRQLLVQTFRQSNRQKPSSQSQLDQSKGRLYRGSSWRYEDKVIKEATAPSSSRYAVAKKQSGISLADSQRKGKKSNGLLDLVGQNLRRSSTGKEEQFFEYVMRFSYRTKKGYIPNNAGKVNQDNFIISPNINSKTWQHFFAVCDGHGPLGHHVSGFIKNTLPACVAGIKMMQRHPRQGLAKAFETTYQKLLKESGIDMSFSGSTIISCYLQQNRLFCSNVGDSRAIIGRQRSGNWEAVPLSVDHKPSLQKQAERIRKMRGRVQAYKDEYGESIGPLRVWVQNDNVPGLAMTRSFGDLVGASVGVSPIPEIKQFNLTEQDKIILIGSDGVFQFLSNQQLIQAVIPFYESKQIQQASDHLMALSTRSWNKNSSIIDDITFILIFISYNEM